MNEQPDERPADDLPTPLAETESALPPEDEAERAAPEGPQPQVETAPEGEPPRIVAETPVGGLRPAVPPSFARPSDRALVPEDEAEVSLSQTETEALAPAEAAPADETLRLTLAEETPAEVAEDVSRPPEDVTETGAQAVAETPPVLKVESFAPTGERALSEEEEETAPAPPAEAAPVAEVSAEETPVSLFNAALAAVAEEATTTEVAAGTPPEADERVTSPQEWEEDLSPELAAVLFGSPRRAAVESARPVAETAAPPATAPTTEPTAPVVLTSDDQAATLPLSAGDQRAPAPEVALTGKVRYTRVEEPLPGDRGQHIVETWVYFKPELPALEGRLVQRVTREEWRYSDGSWRWRYERRYADRGRDSREVRANAARTYFERTDSISQRDATSSKRQQLSEEAALIFAAPVQEEKRGWLRNLFRRGDDHEPGGEKTWRPATSAEIRQARKSGEQALRRGGLFG